MAYGVKRGVRAPGEFGAIDILGLALAGSAGIIAALVTDYRQQGEASALYTINQWVVALADMFGLGQVPLWVIVLGLIGVGAGSTFYFQPITRQGAFAQGFGLLAVIMTAVPADLAGALSPDLHMEGLEELQPASLSREATLSGAVHKASFDGASEARIYKAQSDGEAARYDVDIRIHFPEGIPDDINSLILRGAIRGRLHNEDTGSTYNLFRTAGGLLQREDDTLIIHAGVPARSETATLWIRVECSEYQIEEQSAVATLGETLVWAIEMRTSNTPLFMQRLGKSYWF